LQTTLKSTVKIDHAVHSLTTQIQEAALAATINGFQLTNNIITPVHIKLILAEKRRARAQWQRSKYPIDKLRINYLKNKLSKAIQEHKNVSYYS
jgi:hypothetical protein